MRGIICMAQNNESTDYVRLAYLQRLSLRLTNPDLPYALVTDQASADSMSTAQKSSFDQVIILSVDWAKDQEWKQRNDWQLFAIQTSEDRHVVCNFHLGFDQVEQSKELSKNLIAPRLESMGMDIEEHFLGRSTLYHQSAKRLELYLK